MKKETEKKVTDNKIEKSNALKTLLKKNNSLVMNNILFLVISVITFFILFFTTFIIKNNLPILGSNPNLISPFYEVFIRDGIAVSNLTWFGYVAIVLVLLTLVIGFISLFITFKKRKLLNKQTFICSLINIPLVSFVLVFILIIGLIPVNTANLISPPLAGNVIKDVFDDISLFWVYYLNAPATLTTFGLVIMIISAILGCVIVILAILPFILSAIFDLNNNKSKIMNEAKEKISRIKTPDTKESFRDFKKRIKFVNKEKAEKSKEKLISKNKKTLDDDDLKYLKNGTEELSDNQVSLGTELMKSGDIDIENDDNIEVQVDAFLDEIIGKDK